MLEERIVQKMTIEEFDEFIFRPEFVDKEFEYICGTLIERIPSYAYASMIGANTLFPIGRHVYENKLGYMTGANGGYVIGEGRFLPTGAFISYKRLPRISPDIYYIPHPPELAVEVIRRTDDAFTYRQLRIRLVEFIRAGTIVWVIDPWAQTGEIYRPGERPQIVDKTGILKDEDLLPGFELPMKNIFPAEDENEDA